MSEQASERASQLERLLSENNVEFTELEDGVEGTGCTPPQTIICTPSTTAICLPGTCVRTIIIVALE
jgi:hypothetical protein